MMIIQTDEMKISKDPCNNISEIECLLAYFEHFFEHFTKEMFKYIRSFFNNLGNLYDK
jgi:hypothetical protein